MLYDILILSSSGYYNQLTSCDSKYNKEQLPIYSKQWSVHS